MMGRNGDGLQVTSVGGNEKRVLARQSALHVPRRRSFLSACGPKFPHPGPKNSGSRADSTSFNAKQGVTPHSHDNVRPQTGVMRAGQWKFNILSVSSSWSLSAVTGSSSSLPEAFSFDDQLNDLDFVGVGASSAAAFLFHAQPHAVEVQRRTAEGRSHPERILHMLCKKSAKI